MKLKLILLLIAFGTFSTFIKGQVGPLLTTNWYQDCYYNDSCPAIAPGPCSKAYTGCGATALAMTMKYYGYPSTGRGSHSYTPPGFSVQSANFATTTYNWAGMPNSISTPNTAIAQVMHHTGIALDMGYGSAGSFCSFDASDVLKKYFKYSLTTINVMKTQYSNTAWENLLKTELDAGRVVYLNGGSHFYLCDGYQTIPSLKFHINFGWGGPYNGYYDIHNLVAASTNFTPIGMIIGIKPMDNIEASPDTVVIYNAPQNAYYTINALTTWTASSDQSWFIPNLSSGIADYIYTNGAASGNLSYTPRFATVSVTNGVITKKVVIKQNGITPNLFLSPSLLTYSYSSSMQTGNITCDSNWIVNSADSWISLSPTTGIGNSTLSITVSINPSTSSRTGTVIITRGKLSSSITISQAGNGSFWCTPVLTTPNSVGFSNVTLKTINRNSGIDEGYINTGLSTTLKIDTTYTFYATISGSVAPAVWIDWNIDGDFNDAGEAVVSPSGSWYPSFGGTKNQVFTVPSGAIEGTTRMRVYCKKFGTGPISSPCNVADAGGDIEDYSIQVVNHKQLSLSPPSLIFPNTGNSQNVIVTTDSNWIATTAQPWIIILPAAGTTSATTAVTASANTTVVDRTGLVTYTRGSKIKYVSITQNAADSILSSTSSAINFVADGGVENFDVSSNVSYSLSTAATWFSVSNSTGTGNFSFSLIVTANSLLTSRTDSVVLLSGTKRIVILVTQDAASISLGIEKGVQFYTNEYDKTNTFYLYPNPACETIYFRSSKIINGVEILSTIGDVIDKTTLQDNSISVKNLKTGIYFLRIYSEGQILMRKFIKE